MSILGAEFSLSIGFERVSKIAKGPKNQGLTKGGRFNFTCTLRRSRPRPTVSVPRIANPQAYAKKSVRMNWWTRVAKNVLSWF